MWIKNIVYNGLAMHRKSVAQCLILALPKSLLWCIGGVSKSYRAMAKYYIKSYKKIPQSFLSMINSIDETTGNPTEPYEIKLEKIGWFGRKSEVVKKVFLPKGFNHSKELTTGREWVG